MADDILADIASLYAAYWPAGITKPDLFDEIWELKNIDLREKPAQILYYTVDGADEPWGLSAPAYKETFRISFDIRTSTSRARFIALWKATKDMVKSALKAKYAWVTVVDDKDMSHEYRDIWRGVIDVRWIRFGSVA